MAHAYKEKGDISTTIKYYNLTIKSGMNRHRNMQKKS